MVGGSKHARTRSVALNRSFPILPPLARHVPARNVHNLVLVSVVGRTDPQIPYSRTREAVLMSHLAVNRLKMVISLLARYCTVVMLHLNSG